jgi:hypothetical protein
MAKARWRWLSLVNMDLASSAARWMLSSSVDISAVPLPIGSWEIFGVWYSQHPIRGPSNDQNRRLVDPGVCSSSIHLHLSWLLLQLVFSLFGGDAEPVGIQRPCWLE